MNIHKCRENTENKSEKYISKIRRNVNKNSTHTYRYTCMHLIRAIVDDAENSKEKQILSHFNRTTRSYGYSNIKD